MTASLENRLTPTSAIDAFRGMTQQQQLLIAEQAFDADAAGVQEFGTDAIEGELQDFKWEEGVLKGVLNDYIKIKLTCIHLCGRYRRIPPGL